MAGMVSGSRQMNSIGRRSHGARSRTQVIVGTNSTTMISTVSTTRSTDEFSPSHSGA